MRITIIPCTMNYSLHYEFSDQITKADKHGWQTRRRNPDEEFTLTRETFLSWTTKGYNEYNQWCNFRKGWRSLPNELHFFRKGCKWILWVMSDNEKYSCWKTFLKLGKALRKWVRKKKKSHLHAFYLTKKGLIRKPNKSELATELESMTTKNIPTHLPPIDHHRNVIIDFMTYTGKV